MTKTAACQALRRVLRDATACQARDIADILHLGAGHIELPPWLVCSQPHDVAADRQEVYTLLVDTVRSEGGPNAQDFRPVYDGTWEVVLASLVLRGEWGKIHRTAESLRKMSREQRP